MIRTTILMVAASCCFLCCTIFFCSISNAQILSPPPQRIDTDGSVPIRQLLNQDWERGPKISARSKTTFESAKRFTDDLLVAYTINRIRHKKTSEAKLAAQELTDRHADNLDGWMLKTWLNMLTDDFDVALINMRSFKKQIVSQKNLPVETQKLIYKRLGKFVGYLQGPVADQVNHDLRDETIKVLAAGLKPEILKTFNENRDRVLKQHDDLLKEQGKKTQVILDKAKIENDAEVAQLERQNQLLEQTESKLLPEKQKLSAEASKQITAIEQQGSQLSQQLSSTVGEIRAIELDLQYLYQDLFLINQQPPEFRQSTFLLRNQIRNAELTLGSLKQNAGVTANQLNGLHSQIAQIQASANRQVNEIEKEIKRVGNSKLRNLSKLTKIAQGPKIASGKRQSLKSRLTGLRTYDDLSLELYRQDIISQLSK